MLTILNLPKERFMGKQTQSFQDMLDYVHLYRLKNKLLRETAENDRRIRDNRKRALLLNNLNQYITDSMTVADIRAIIANMHDDYESRVDDITIRNAELSKERRIIRQKMAIHAGKKQSKEDGKS
ncbi:hypothetical protein SAMN05444853_12145 [Pasteurella skyensis]|uniref:Pole-localizer protein TmaR n=2 Tax=Phocoenobacter skyensis TaxID=97481 RepID=A0A1H7Z2U8_9PAST|nr:hypothetical protein SAMN05444853_12145 [Pasteurella skyensis]